MTIGNRYSFASGVRIARTKAASSGSSVDHTSYLPLCFTASLAGRLDRPCAASSGFFVRWAIRARRALSDALTRTYRLDEVDGVGVGTGTRELTAGTAERWARIWVYLRGRCFCNRFLTTEDIGWVAQIKQGINSRFSSPWTSTENSCALDFACTGPLQP